MLPPLLRATWLDAYAENEWAWEAPEIGDGSCVTVGFLVAENDAYLVLAATHGFNDTQSNARFAIPKGCITKRETLPCPE